MGDWPTVSPAHRQSRIGMYIDKQIYCSWKKRRLNVDIDLQPMKKASTRCRPGFVAHKKMCTQCRLYFEGDLQFTRDCIPRIDSISAQICSQRNAMLYHFDLILTSICRQIESICSRQPRNYFDRKSTSISSLKISVDFESVSRQVDIESESTWFNGNDERI